MLAILVALIGITGWLIQDQLFLNWDVSALLHMTEYMLNGGTYSNNNPNPPSTFLLYALPIILSKWLGANIILTFRAYIFLINTTSLLICYLIAKPIFPKQDQSILNIFIAIIALTFFILPFHEFGQRDILFYTLTLPYLLLITSRLQKNHTKTTYVIITGFLAALGIIIKPHFLILLLIIECYYIYRIKKILSVLRPEVITMAILFFLYTISIFVLFPDYIYEVMPYILENYYACLGQPWFELLFHPTVVFTWLVLPSFILYLRTTHNYNDLFTILFLSLSGFIVLYFSQHTLYLYHILPVFFTVILLLTIYFMSLLKNNISAFDYVTLSLMGALFAIGFSPFRQITIIHILNPALFFLFYAFLYSALLSIAWPETKWTSILLKVIMIISLTLPIRYLAQHSDFQTHATTITLIMMLALFALFTKKTKHGMVTQIYIAVLASIIIFPIINQSRNLYGYAQRYKNTTLTPLIKFANKQPAKSSIYALSFYVDINYPLIHYTDVVSIDRFYCLWMIANLAKYRDLHGDSALREYIKNNMDKRFFINMIAEDFHKHKPSIILVDIRAHNTQLYGKEQDIDMLDYFSENPLFHAELQNYQFDSIINPGFELAVYKRITATPH